MIERFQYYINENLVRKCTPNKAEAKSFMERAAARLEYINQQRITESSASFIFEDIYEAIREAGQALMELKGYKPYSHEAVIAFLKEFFTFSTYDISIFNRYRVLRNKIVYRTEHISVQTCKDALTFLKHFLPIVKTEFEKTVKPIH